MSEPRYFAVYNRDRPGMADLRTAHRDAHLAFMKSLGPVAKLGGPLMAEDGETRMGGMYVVEAESLEAARALATRDPYVQAGLFEVAFVNEWRWQTRNV